MLNKTLRGYYKRMLYQNRGPVARGLDFLALRLVPGVLSIPSHLITTFRPSIL